MLVVHSLLPVKSVRELIALAKARPGALNYGSGAAGTASHLGAELFKFMARVDITRINYKSAAMAANDLIAGHVQLMFAPAAAVASHISSGRLRALGITSAGPSVLFPTLPTVASALPGYKSDITYGVSAPAKTAWPVINRLNLEIVRVLNTADTKDRCLKVGIEVIGSSPEQFAFWMKAEMAKWGKLINEAGLSAE
jgi:tripartite-type tricarboxylate transporter receptor subunit TctC